MTRSPSSTPTDHRITVPGLDGADTGEMGSQSFDPMTVDPGPWPAIPPDWSPLIGVDPPGHWEIPIAAGPVSLVARDGDLYQVTIDGICWAQRIYVGVRDVAWHTLSCRTGTVSTQREGDIVQLWYTLQAASAQPADAELDVLIDLMVTVGVASEGAGVSVSAVIRPQRPFRAGKIGLCILHDTRTHLGATYTAAGPGTHTSGRFADRIDPQLFRDGAVTAMFDPYDRLQLQLPSGAVGEWTFSGDTFEMQDHRNWADLSLKTYSTPQRLGWSHAFHPDHPQQQTVQLRSERSSAPADPYPGSPASAPADQLDAPVILRVRDPVSLRLRLGCNLPPAFSPVPADLITALSPDHLRVAVTAAEVDSLVARFAAGGGAAVELVLLPHDAADAHRLVAAVADALQITSAALAAIQVGAVDATGAELEVPDPELLAATREALAAHGLPSPDCTGTTSHFCALNRAPMAWHPGTAAVIGVTTQLHVADSATVMLNILSVADIAESMRQLVGADTPRHASPVTLIGREGPSPTGPIGLWGQPAWLDPRLFGCYGAAWTLAMIAGLSRGGFTSATVLDLSGPRGVIVTDRTMVGGMLPADARVVPAYHVLADVLAAVALEPVTVSLPERLAAVALRGSAAAPMLACANLGSTAVTVDLDGLGDRVRVRILDTTTASMAISDPRGFRGEAGWRPTDTRLTLGAYATALCQAEPTAPEPACDGPVNM